jgi:short-subunit dehydrogenase
MISSSHAKMEESVRKIQHAYHMCKVMLIEFDFSENLTSENYQKKIVEKIQPLDISILINNISVM